MYYILLYCVIPHRNQRGAEAPTFMPGMATAPSPPIIIRIIREFKDAVFEDVVFDNNSCVTMYCGQMYYNSW